MRRLSVSGYNAHNLDVSCKMKMSCTTMIFYLWIYLFIFLFFKFRLMLWSQSYHLHTAMLTMPSCSRTAMARWHHFLIFCCHFWLELGKSDIDVHKLLANCWNPGFQAAGRKNIVSMFFLLYKRISVLLAYAPAQNKNLPKGKERLKHLQWTINTPFYLNFLSEKQRC